MQKMQIMQTKNIIILMKIPTREYMAHKAEYDARYYASHISGDPANVILRVRTRHAGNQPGSRQCDYLAFINRKAAAIVHKHGELYDHYLYEWWDYQRKQRRRRKDPNTYEIIYVHPTTEQVRRHTYQCTTITLYIRCRLREQFPFHSFHP